MYSVHMSTSFINRMLAIVKLLFKKLPKQLTLNNNDFSFNNKIYLQVRGIGMGKTQAPLLTNIYWFDFDKYLMQGSDGGVPIASSPFLYDVFLVWGETFSPYRDSAHILIL